jgi:hypothetical protein
MNYGTCCLWLYFNLNETYYLQSAYKKDDFFDTISSNSMTRGRGSRNRLSARTRQDTEVCTCTCTCIRNRNFRV